MFSSSIAQTQFSPTFNYISWPNPVNTGTSFHCFAHPWTPTPTPLEPRPLRYCWIQHTIPGNTTSIQLIGKGINPNLLSENQFDWITVFQHDDPEGTKTFCIP